VRGASICASILAACLCAVAQAAGQTAPQNRSQLSLAQRYIETGKAAQAIQILRPFLRQHPQSPEANCLMGEALSELGKLADSDRYLEKALQLDKGQTLAIRLLGVNAFEVEHLETAGVRFHQLLRILPGDEEAHIYLAQIALRRKEFQVAASHLLQAPKISGGDAKLQLLLARALLGAGRLEEAKKTLLKVRTSDPVLLFETGGLMFNAQLYREAIQKFEQSRPGHPEPTTVDYNIALADFQLGQYAVAARILQNAIAVKQDDPDILSLLGDIYRQQGKFGEAADALLRAVQLAPDQEQRYTDLLGVYVAMVDVDKGLEFARVGLRRYRSNYQLYALRAWLYALKEQYPPAESDFRRAIGLSPRVEWLYSGLGMVLILDDRLEEARKLLEAHVVEFRNDHIFYLYADVLDRLGLDRAGPFQEKALRLLEQSVALNPRFPPSRLLLGRIYGLRKDWPAALSQFQAAVALDPGEKRGYYELFQVYKRTGERQRAAEMLGRVRKLNEEERNRPGWENTARRIQALQAAMSQQRKE
jgi:tetratricopeptide (TPR) repeat protein